ncbi:MAG: nucleoside deaminase [Nitrospirales bacterium]|nr:nucleoside deaminase [Nitrospirales bacterium]
MSLALREAEEAFREAEVPVGAVLVINGEVVASAHNTREASSDPTAHAEILVMRAAAQQLRSWRLSDAALYVTKEPCIMCAGAMVNARLGRLVYGCYDTKAGGIQGLYRILSDSRLNHQVEVVSGVMEEECAAILKEFFRRRRGRNRDVVSGGGRHQQNL